MAKRECGDCTACCRGWVSTVVEGQRLGPGSPCAHCTDAGCGIYERRPVEPCRRFECAWLMQDSPLDEDMRPDKSGAIVKWHHKFMKWWIMYVLPVGEEVPAPTIERLTRVAREHQMPIFMLRHEFSDGQCIGHHKIGFGPPEFVVAINSPEAARGEGIE